ncbi:MAG: hypothetical protein HOQ24_08790 [Mycobacteriaceae bacterium]|nr:hypothetical protein [Mycobacteriaceae bacterium]
MKRRLAPLTLLAVVLTVAALVGVKLKQATEYGGGVSSSPEHTVVLDVRTTPAFLQTSDAAAQGLWLACTGSISGTPDPLPRRHQDGTYAATIRPALAADTERRLLGCLQDMTLDNVRGRVVASCDQPVMELYDAADRAVSCVE